jgi:hypothetical protein
MRLPLPGMPALAGLLALVVVGPATPGRAAAPPPARETLADQVRGAIERGLRYLRVQQRKGNWEVGVGPTPAGGWTSLALLALLEAGVKPDDPAVQRGLTYLRTVEPRYTYVVGLQTIVFVRAGQKDDRERIQRNVDWLLSARLPDGWSYLKPEAVRANIADNSNSQYALLGLHEAIGAGIKVSPAALQSTRSLYLRSQSADGGWGYRPSLRRSTITMTSAGLAGLVIADRAVGIGKQKLRPDGSAENCGEYDDNRHLTAALTWLGDHFPARLTADNAAERLGSPFYCLHGIERVGRLTGQRYLGGHDWYEVGCRFLVETQRADSSWSGAGGPMTFDHQPIVATSFALLFLIKGRTPVLVSKLAYGGKDETGWNNKRNDVRHLTEFASRELFKGRSLAWQVFDVRGRKPSRAEIARLAAALAESPVVFFNGHRRAPGGEEAILKEYLGRGGLVLAEACCGDKAFDRDFRALAKRLFPAAPLKPLPADHPLWKAAGKFKVSPRDFPLEGIEQGGRVVVIYSPKPLAGYWEANLHDKGRGEKAFDLGACVIAYATGLKPPPPRASWAKAVKR